MKKLRDQFPPFNYLRLEEKSSWNPFKKFLGMSVVYEYEICQVQWTTFGDYIIRDGMLYVTFNKNKLEQIRPSYFLERALYLYLYNV